MSIKYSEENDVCYQSVSGGDMGNSVTQLKTSSVDLNTYPIQPEALLLIPESLARKLNAIPMAIHNGCLLVGMTELDNIFTIEALTTRAGMRIEPVLAPADQIQQAIDRNYKAFAEIEKQLADSTSAPSVKEKAIPTDVAGAPVVRALELIIQEAIKNRASDIHIEPQEDNLRVRYRIDGVLHDTMSLPLSAHSPILTRIKVLANMDIADHRPQDGQFSAKARGREVDIRVATIDTTYGHTATLRILDKTFAALSLSEIGFLPESQAQYEEMLRSNFGMILVSGPTGSGKTTTLYASINSLDSIGRKIVTIEDPVEYRFKNINQIQVNPRGGLTFANGLRSIMRLDPDVILVGEIRDKETAEIAIQAALTGHLVLSSVHASNTVNALFRLLDLDVGPFLISAAVIGIINQRMVRRICPHCQRLTPVPPTARVAYNKELNENRKEFMYGKGCNACSNTGYLGRTALFEILTLNNTMRSMVADGANAEQITEKAKEQGMISTWRDGMLKVKKDITTPSEVLRNVFSIG